MSWLLSPNLEHVLLVLVPEKEKEREKPSPEVTTGALTIPVLGAAKVSSANIQHSHYTVPEVKSQTVYSGPSEVSVGVTVPVIPVRDVPAVTATVYPIRYVVGMLVELKTT